MERMMKKACPAWAVFLFSLGGVGCAPQDDEATDFHEGVLDAHPDETPAGDDCCGEGLPDGGEDSAAEVVAEVPPDALPEVLPEVVGDTEDTVEADVPLPTQCSRSGARECGPTPIAGDRCPDGPSEFAGDVNAAIDATIAGHPEWFDTAGYPGCCPLIHPENVNDYMQAVTDILIAGGLCASGPGEELAVKFNNECSEAWDIVANPDAATNLVRRHYVGNCFPSFF
jgi:hypothetical protein